MSELTPCNYDTLQAMKRQHGANNVRTVVVKDGDMVGWVRVDVYRNREWREGRAYFMALTDHCIC